MAEIFPGLSPAYRQAGVEVVTEELLRLLGALGLVGFDVERRVHGTDSSGRGKAFRAADVRLSEQELPE